MLQRLRLCRTSDTVFRREIDSRRQWGYGTCYGGIVSPLRRSVPSGDAPLQPNPQTVIIVQALEECKPPPRPDRDPDHYQHVITCTFYHPSFLHKILFQSVHNFFSNVGNRLTGKGYRQHNFLVGDKNARHAEITVSSFSSLTLLKLP